MKEIKLKRKIYAKWRLIVQLLNNPLSFGNTFRVDRTKQKDKYKYDIEMKSTKSCVNKNRRIWVYLYSDNSIVKCIKNIKKPNKQTKQILPYYTDLRIVESKTGLVVKQFKL